MKFLMWLKKLFGKPQPETDIQYSPWLTCCGADDEHYPHCHVRRSREEREERKANNEGEE